MNYSKNKMMNINDVEDFLKRMTIVLHWASLFSHLMLFQQGKKWKGNTVCRDYLCVGVEDGADKCENRGNTSV